MKEQPDIYNLKLCETTELDTGFFTRVPGGWVFNNYSSVAPCFIPFNREFESPKKESIKEKPDCWFDPYYCGEYPEDEED